MSTSSLIVDGRQGDSRLSFDCSLPGDTLVSRGEKRKRGKGNRSGRVNSGIDPNNNELRPVQPGNPSTLPTANSIDRPRATRTFGASVQSSKSYVTHQSSLLLFLLLVLPLNVFSWGRSQHNSAFSIKSIRTINRNSPLTFLWKGTRPSPIQMSQNQPDNSKSIRVLGVCGGIGSGKVSAS